MLIYDVRDPTRMNDYNVPNGPYARYHANFKQLAEDLRAAYISHYDGPSLNKVGIRTLCTCRSSWSSLVDHLGRKILLGTNSPTHWETNWSGQEEIPC